ncbi:ABC transporter substrate-binding protein [Litorihabitans aurantiacus]|uniref:ABC transporter substrate-binding protein n=1 Tax=Litorihabitans aurantiacus TaxID=1930061 RepID=A0AA37XFL2_9MICO|nr:ABC transporter substrate-binding protein [Litorihabitans aurantiacus]GMA32503.1 ABC transporter substrate-binding protein [Litorihabitans aurantiacus]
MIRKPARASLALAASAALLISACSGGNSASNPSDSADDGDAGAGAGGGTLVVDTAFSLETGDPGRNYVPTGSIVLHAMYETLLTFDGDDESTPVPALATMEANDAATEFTFTLTGDRTFSDGSPIDADDVVFSLERLAGMESSKANFLMAGIEVTKVDDTTVVLTTTEPSLQVPAIVTNPALSILNSELVEANGGTTDDTDAAEDFLGSTSAGSGPYVLDQLDLTSQVVLVPNPDYDGEKPAAYDRIVVRNVTEPATQLTNLRGGDSQLALDLSGDQVAGLGSDLDVNSVPGAQSIFLLLNQDAGVSGTLANPAFAEAVRYALDYDALLELAGDGSVEASGVIPPMFLGALEEGVTQDLDRSAAALAESGYQGETISLRFPNDNPVGGVDFTTLGERVQSQLQAAGIQVSLAPGPFASEIDPYVDGTGAFSMWYWGPDFADSSSFLPFGPGEKVGLRAGWTADAAPDVAALVAAAKTATDPVEREAAFTDYATAMQESGAFVPLLVPARHFASSGVDGVAYNSNWTVDLTDLSPAE